MAEGSLSAGHARALLPLEQEKLQKEAAAQIIRQQMSVRQTEALVKRMLRPPAESVRDPLAVDYIRECETSLTRHLGRRTTIHAGKKKGKIELEYYGEEDLQRLIEALEILPVSEK